MAKVRAVQKSGEDELQFSKDPLSQRKVENVLDDLEWTVKHLIVVLPDDNEPIVVEFLSDVLTKEIRSSDEIKMFNQVGPPVLLLEIDPY